MSVLLNRSYGAYAAGTVVSLPASTEAAIIAQNIGQSSAAAVTDGAITSNEFAGRVGVSVGAALVVITNPNVTPSSKISAAIAQVAAPTGFTSITRVVAGNGQFTIYGNAAATTNAVQIDWVITATGLTPNQ